jgi:hypothetical protein
VPQKLERKLKAQAKKLHLHGKRLRAYVFGTLTRVKKKSRVLRIRF